MSESIGSVRDAIIIGLFLAGIIIWLFLRDLGTALMTGLVMPVAICVTFIAMKMLGQSFNMMTLGGLAAAGGLVIDDAIVVVENIVLHRDGGEGRLEAVSEALERTDGSADRFDANPHRRFLPLISITGVTGTFFRALAIAMSVSLLTSLGLALTWSTNLGVYLIRAARKKARAMPQLDGNHEGMTAEPIEREQHEADDGRGRRIAEGRILRKSGHRSTNAGCAALWNIRCGWAAFAPC